MGKSSVIVLLLAGACALAAPAAAPAAYTCRGADDAPALVGLHRARSATFCLINLARVHRGLPILLRQRRLMDSSGRFSRQMVRRRFFSHAAPDGMTLAQRVGRGGRLGEMLAWGPTEVSSPSRVMRDWMASPPHRRLILNTGFTQMGMGIALGSPIAGPAAPAATYTVNFAR